MKNYFSSQISTLPSTYFYSNFPSSSQHSLNSILALSLHCALYRSISCSSPPYSDSIQKECYFHLAFKVLLIDELFYLFPDWTVYSFLSHYFLHLDQVVLLRAEDRTRSGNTNPTNKLGSWKVIMFHRITCDKSACSSKPSFTMNSNSSFRTFRKLHEFMHNLQRRYAPIRKVQLLMIDIIILKMNGVICLIIQPYNYFNSQLLEYWNIVSGCEYSILDNAKFTPYLSCGFYEGLLKAMNLRGIIQFKSPFSTFSKCSYSVKLKVLKLNHPNLMAYSNPPRQSMS